MSEAINERWTFLLLVFAVYAGAVGLGAGVVVIMEMTNLVALRGELTVAAIVSWLIGFLAIYITCLFMEGVHTGSLTVPRKRRRLLFAALWPIMIWRVQVDQTPRTTGVKV